MTNFCWWLVDRLSLILDPDERDAVYGDITELNESGGHALRDLLGLVARRQVARLKLWRPWTANATISRIAATGTVCFVCLVGGTGLASRDLHDYDGHQSSLPATLIMADGSSRAVILQGVGCSLGMCSRVWVKDMNAGGVWLDGLASVRTISCNQRGPVEVIFTFRDGTERQSSIIEGNRFLYMKDTSGLIKKLDLARLAEIDFE
jgi:hypothetical protein